MKNIKYYITRGFIEPTDVVIDAGCQDGTGTKLLSAMAKKVVGIDKDVSMIKAAMQNNSTENSYFMSENIDQMESFPNSDVVVAIDLLEKLRFPDSFIGKVLMSTKRLFILVSDTKKDLSAFNDWTEILGLTIENKTLSIYKRI